MSIIFVDSECIENKIVKELGVYKNGQPVGCSFIPPKKLKVTSQSASCTKRFPGINWSSGHKKYTELVKIVKKLKAPETNS